MQKMGKELAKTGDYAILYYEIYECPQKPTDSGKYYGKTQVLEQAETVKDWYDGYTFGQTDIYNPWSVLQYLADARKNTNWLPMSYWANTSSNDIVRELVDRAGDEEKEKIECLMAGGTIEVQIHEDVTYKEIYEEGDNLWNFMFFTGYFRKIRESRTGK